jgi:sulfite reductase (NADPH) hemoprotein beta-component
MYVYDQYDRTIVAERVAQFRDQVRRRLAGELTEDEFRPLRLMNGLYLQLHAYMLRIAVPYGLLSSTQMRMLAHIARKYDRGYGHFTTRQNIQFNWPKLEDVPDILADLASVEMHAIQTSGNCVRNVTSDEFAGAAADEIEDPRPYAEIIRQWSTFHPEFSYLPRKFKIAITGATNDRAAVAFHDIGIRIVRNEKGDNGFEIQAGGGQGRTPAIGIVIFPFVRHRDLFTSLEAILRVYNLLGRRDNLFKSRIKILVAETGPDKFRAMCEDELRRIRDDHKDSSLDLTEDEVRRVQAFFPAPPWRTLPATDASYEIAKRSDREFANWTRACVVAHKQPGYAIAVISLKPHDGIAGDCTAEQMEAIAALADELSFGEVVVTHEQNLVLPHVEQSKLHGLFERLVEIGCATPNLGLLTNMIVCPGLDYCSLANARSIPVSQTIAKKFDDLDRLHDIGQLDLNISGCINACGHHHVGHIGILGVNRHGEEYYQVSLGGYQGNEASIGDILGPAFREDQVAEAVEKVIEVYLGQRIDGERFIDTYRRIGKDPFKARVYAKEPKEKVHA